MSTFSSLSVRLISPSESLDSIRLDGGSLDVVPPSGASHLETWLSYGARCCPRLIFRGAMHVVVGESKEVPLSGTTKSRHLLATPQASWVDCSSTREIQLELSFFGGDRRRSRRGDVTQFRTSFFFAVLTSMVAVFGLAGCGVRTMVVVRNEF